MDPQKLPNPNRPEDEKTANPNNTAEDASMSEESSVPPGTVVVGGSANPDTDMASTPPEPPEQPPVPTPEGSQDKMAEFMHEPNPSDVPPAPMGGKKIGLIVGIIVAVLVVLGGAAAAYFAFMKPSPDKVLQAALVNSFSKDKAKSVAFEGDLSVTDDASDATYTMGFNGATGENGQLTLNASINIPSFPAVTFDLRSTDGKTMYLKAGGLAGIAEGLASEPSLASYASLLAAVDDQWYTIDPSILEQFGASVPSSTGLADADRQKLADAYTQNSFLKVQEVLADETIAGVNSYHYKVGVDGQKLKAFVSAVEAAKIESLGLTQPMLDSLKSSIDNADFSKYPVDIWIAKDSKLFTQFAFKVQDNDATLDTKLTLKDYNKAVTVEVPEGAESIVNVLTTFYQAMLGGGLGSDDLLQ